MRRRLPIRRNSGSHERDAFHVVRDRRDTRGGRGTGNPGTFTASRPTSSNWPLMLRQSPDSFDRATPRPIG